jgi:opacity protein-like surface antigen
MVRVGVRWVTIGWLVALAPAQSWGQTWAPPEAPEMGVTGRLVWNIGGTMNVPLSSTADNQDLGWGFAVGLTYNPSLWGGIQFEYGADWANLKTGKAAGLGIHGTSFFQYFNLNLLVRPVHPLGAVGFYLIGGGGLYYRSVDISRIDGTVPVTYCDPWLYYCSVVPATSSTLLATRSSWDWGLDAGVGVTFALSPVTRLYLEARYHYIWGPEFTAQDGSKHSANGQYIPLTLGVRF